MGLNSTFEGKRLVCFVDTPFQIIGLLALFSLPVNRRFLSCDVYIDSAISDAEGIAERLRAEKIFTSIACGESESKTCSRHLGFQWIFNRRFREELRNRLVRCFPSLGRRSYDVLVCSAALPQTLVLKHYFVSGGYSVFFDDGSGSHNGNVFKPFYCQDDVLSASYRALGGLGRVKAAAKRITRSISVFDFRYDIRELWLFSPTQSDRSIYKNLSVFELPVFGNEGLFRRVISPNLNSEPYAKRFLIFLTTSQTAPDHVKCAEIELLKRLQTCFGNQIGVRVHPNRSASDFDFCRSLLLPAEDSWELLLLSGAVGEDSVLISYGSSCQLHPKSFCGIEPCVVFLYRTLNPAGDESTIALGQSVRSLQDSYSHKERVLVPKDYDEFVNQLKRLGICFDEA